MRLALLSDRSPGNPDLDKNRQSSASKRFHQNFRSSSPLKPGKKANGNVLQDYTRVFGVWDCFQDFLQGAVHEGILDASTVTPLWPGWLAFVGRLFGRLTCGSDFSGNPARAGAQFDHGDCNRRHRRRHAQREDNGHEYGYSSRQPFGHQFLRHIHRHGLDCRHVHGPSGEPRVSDCCAQRGGGGCPGLPRSTYPCKPATSRRASKSRRPP